MRNAVYNSRVPYMVNPYPRCLRTSVLLLALFLVISNSNLCASNWSAPQGQLAQKIAGVTGPGAVAVDFSNRSSLSKNDFDEVRRGMLTELAALGIRFVKAEQAAATVQVTLSENLESYVWIAEIRQGAGESSVMMVSLPRPESTNTTREGTALTLRKTLLWSQQDRILDAAVIEGNPSHLLVLDPTQAALYKLQDGRWQPEQSLPIAHARPWPRDLHGRLVLQKDHLFDAYLPGVFCQSSITAPLGLNCRESDDPWPLGTDQLSLSAFFTPARNFFPGVLVPGVGKQTTAPAFHSAAPLPRDKYVLWLFAAVDGQIHLLDGIRDQVLAKSGWGSDVVTVKTNCGLGWQVLATRAGDSSTDVVRAFEMADREPTPVSQPVEFNGGITALWTDASGSGAIAVSRNSETGVYEAYRLAIACSQ
jgi:hypothetical protein